jgi:hypothetical protein
MMAETDFADPDSPAARAAMQCGDPEVTAWAWAAGVHLGLDPKIVIKDEQYDGTGASLRLGLRSNAYFGINGLAASGFCAVRPGPYPNRQEHSAYSRESGLGGGELERI